MSAKRTAASALNEIVAQADCLYALDTHTSAHIPDDKNVLASQLGECIEGFVIHYGYEGKTVMKIMKGHSEDGRTIVIGATSTLELLEYLHLLLRASLKSGYVAKSVQHAIDLVQRRIKVLSPDDGGEVDKARNVLLDAVHFTSNFQTATEREPFQFVEFVLSQGSRLISLPSWDLEVAADVIGAIRDTLTAGAEPLAFIRYGVVDGGIFSDVKVLDTTAAYRAAIDGLAEARCGELEMLISMQDGGQKSN
jgi:hypothetical protein